MKKKKLIIFMTIILFVITILAITYGVYSDNNKFSTEENTTEQINESQKQMQELAEHLEKNVSNNIIIEINDNAGNEIEITQSYIDTVGMIEDTKESEKRAIEYTIYATEAKNMNIQLSNEDVEEIKKVSNSEEILKHATNKKNKDMLKSEIETYLTNIYYKSELENKIQDEITNNKLSIDNENLHQKMIEYTTIQDNFKENTNPSDEERKKYLESISKKYFEIKNLYMDLIKAKYNINNE